MTTPSQLPKSSLYHAEAIVLRHMPLGEADRLIVFYTKESGKLRASAKGTRRTTSRMGGHLEPLTHSSLLVVRGSNLDIISQAQNITSFAKLRDDLQRVARALYVAELVDLFTEEQEPHLTLFQLFLDTLNTLTTVDISIIDLMVHRFEMQLLGLMGYRPQFDSCAINGEEFPDDTPLAFSVSWGGLVCPACTPRDPSARRISANGVSTLITLQSGSLDAVSRISITPEGAKALTGLMRWYIQAILEREVRSGAFLDSLS